MYRKTVVVAFFALAGWMAEGQTQNTAPNVSQVLLDSSLTNFNINGSTVQAVPSVFTETGTQTTLGQGQFGAIVTNASNYSVSRSFIQLSSALNGSIATALSIIPLSSPASGVIQRTDPATGAELPVSSTLGPIFTERAETIGKGQWYIGFSNQDFHFTKFNGTSLNALSLLSTGKDPSAVINPATGTPFTTVPATFGLGMDVRLSQDIAFITYGVTDRFDISVGLPTVHAAVAARTWDGAIYAGNGFASHGSACWCVDTFTPGSPTIAQENFGTSSLAKTGFGDLLIRAKGTVYRTPGVVIAVGGDLRLPTGDAKNYLGVGTTSVKPFAAVSFYTKPFRNGIVLSPHFDIGWQFSGKSVLGGELEGTPIGGATGLLGGPFTSTKGFLPDVLSWAAGAEVALGHRTTFIADILANEVGLIHGIYDTSTQTISGLALPTGPHGDATGAAVPAMGSATGLVSSGLVSYGQYSASFGYKARLIGNLVANVNVLIRLDNNGLVSRVVPLFGIGYSF
jgi:hypothetical protein